MRYVSTRGGGEPQRFCQILLEGLAPDGGLYVPEAWPRLPAAEIEALRPLHYRELAFALLARFIDDIPAGDLRGIIGRAYTAENFGSDEITPLRPLGGGLSLLRLSDGPTLAFKDVAMQLLGQLFEYQLAREGRLLNILGATSGDTGSAAEHAMRGRRGVRVFMLSPLGRMSPFQTAQMYSLQDPNIHNIAIRGVFDHCQDIVKEVSADAGFKSKYAIGTVNSINWARLLAQVVYYFKGYFAATAGRPAGSPVSFSVPSGNFGNICAGHVARMMGLPVRRLVLAANENNVLDEFFRTGVYRPRDTREVFATSSPSMDISKASNFERYVHDLVGRDPARLRELWRRIDSDGQFDLSGSAYFREVETSGFVSDFCTHADRIDTIRRMWRDHGVMIDPHTANGVKAAAGFIEPGVPMVCLETALPAKFAETLREALGREPERPARFAGIESLPQRFETLDPDTDAVKRLIERSCA